jgi:phosphate/sulfate permease
VNRSAVLAHVAETAVDVATEISARLLPVAAALLLLGVLQFAAAACTPEPAPYAARAAIAR